MIYGILLLIGSSCLGFLAAVVILAVLRRKSVSGQDPAPTEQCTCAHDSEPGAHHAVTCRLYRSPFRGPEAKHWDNKLREWIQTHTVPDDHRLNDIIPYGAPPVAREVQKEVVPAGKAFGKMEYEDVQLKFLDNFLLKYFHSIIMVPGPIFATGPWKQFCEVNEWAKGMPELFWLMTGYRPDEYQLNSAISEYCRRIALSKAVNK